MAPTRFFFPEPLDAPGPRPVPDDLAHRLLRVLRLRDGTPLTLFDGQGGEHPATLHIDGKRCTVDVGERTTREAELAGELTLAQGLPSGDKMDWIVEKAVELGVRRLVPIQARRSVVQLGDARQAKRMAHWQRIVQSASEQCGRNRLMHITPPCTLADYLAEPADSAPRLCCDPAGHASLQETLAAHPADRFHLLVGPEGGWADDERALAQRHGAKLVTFGQRVLRTETAGVALVAAVSALRDWH